MNKKLLIVSILAVFMLAAISMASAVNTKTAATEKKESPLYGIRTRLAIGDRLKDLRENIQANYIIGGRIYFLPFQFRLFERVNYFILPSDSTHCITMCLKACFK